MVRALWCKPPGPIHPLVLCPRCVTTNEAKLTTHSLMTYILDASDTIKYVMTK